jgi:PAS domain S-box-containing protein
MVSKSSHPFVPIETDIPEAIFLINGEGTIRFATPAAANYYGYSLDDLVGCSVLRLVAPQDADLLVARWEAFIDNPTAHFDETVVAMVLANGQQILMRLSAWRLPDPDNFLLLHHVQEHSGPRRSEMPNSFLALDTTLEEIRRMVPCETISLFMRESNGKYRMVRMHGRQVELSTRSLESMNDFETTRIIRETCRPLVIDNCRRDPRWKASSNQKHVQSWLGAPLIHRGEFLGLLNLDRTEPNTFLEREVVLVQTLANHVATALYNIRQYEEELKRAERFEALNEVSQAISRLDLEDVLEVVYRKISNLMDTSSFFIGLYDAEAGQVLLAGAYEHEIHQSDQIINAGEGLIGEVLRTRQSIIIHNVAEAGLPSNVIIDGEESASLMMMPLIAQENIVGVISVQSYEPNAYTEDDTVMLETIAGSVATAIQNAQLYDQTANRLAALSALHQMGLELSAVKEPQRVVELTVKTVLELFHPGQVRIFLPGDTHWDAKLWVGHGTGHADQPRIRLHKRPIPDTLTEQVHFGGEPKILYNLTENKEFQAEYRTAWLIHAAVAYPLQRGETQLGVLTLLHSEPQFFRHDILRVLELLCMQAASALENALYYVRLRSRLDETSGLQVLARQVSASQSLDDMLQIVVRTIYDIYRCKSVGIALVEPDQQRVVYRAAVGIKDEYFQKAVFKIGEGVAGRIAAEGKPIYVPDTYADHSFPILDPEVRCLLGVPLTTHDQVIGILSIDSNFPHSFTPDHERLLTIAGGQIAAAIETIRLLQDTRRHADELAQANETLNALDDLRNELIQNLSHELRSPLALVRGYASLLRDNELGPVTKDQADALVIIDEKADSITKMINDILSLEQIRPETMEMCPLDLIDLCQRAVDGARLVFQDRNVSFETHMAEGTWTVQGDRIRLNQVFDNLIGNAVKFSPDGGIITVDSANGSDHHIEISVTDQGIGIPADKLPHIFERFFQADRSIKHRFGGAGLGLSIVQRIVEAHQGQIWVESQEGKGSTFTFSLPLVSER